MARTKITEAPRLQSWSEVDGTMKQVAACERVMVELTTDMNRELDEIKRRYAEQARPVQERIDQYGEDIRQFVHAHRAEMEGKTKELNFGRAGFRLSTKLRYNRGVKAPDVIAALTRLDLAACIKTTQTVIADMLKRQPADILAKVGAYIDRSDEFWYETKQEELVPEGQP